MDQVNHLVLQVYNVLLCFCSHLQASCDGALHRPHHDRHPRGHGTHVRHHLRRSSPLQQVSTPSYVPSTFHYVLQYSSSTAVFYVLRVQYKIHSPETKNYPFQIIIIYRLIILINGPVFGTLRSVTLTVKLKGGGGEFTLFDQN